MRPSRWIWIFIALLWESSLFAAEPYYHPSPPAQGSLDGLGVQFRIADPKPGELEILAASGCKWVRLELNWAATEREKGTYDFTAIEALAKSFQKVKVRVVFTLTGANPLYDGGAAPTSEAARAAFAKWAVAAVARFKGRGYLWEIWDEPNRWESWGPEPKAEDYIALVRETCTALRHAGLTQVRGGEAILGPSILGVDLPFLEKCFQAGLLDDWSGVSVHLGDRRGSVALDLEYAEARDSIARFCPKEKEVPLLVTGWRASFGSSSPEESFLTDIANDVPLTILYEWHAHVAEVGTAKPGSDVVKAPPGKSVPSLKEDDLFKAAQDVIKTLAGYHFSKELVVHGRYWNDARHSHILLFTNGKDERLAVWKTAEAPEQEIYIPASHGLFRQVICGDRLSGERLAAGDDGIVFPPLWHVDILIPEHPNDFLRVAAASPRAPLDFVYNWPGEETLPIPADAKPSGLENPNGGSGSSWGGTDDPNPRGLVYGIKNPLRRPLELVFGFSSPNYRLKASERWEWEIGVTSESRQRRHDEVEGFQIKMGDGQSFRLQQRTHLLCLNPLEVEAFPPSEHSVPLRLANPSGEAALGVVVAQYRPLDGFGDERHVLPFSFAAGEREKWLEIPRAQSPAAAELQITVNQDWKTKHASSENQQVLEKWIPAMVPLPAWTAAAHHLIVERAPGEQSPPALAEAEPKAGKPASQTPCLKLEYRAGKGRTIVRVVGEARPIATVPLDSGVRQSHANALGLWIYGDGQGGVPGIRVTDATGQLFQYSGEPIDWTGWRFVTFRFPTAQASQDCACDGANENPAWWGGENDGAAHYPLRWDTAFLLDVEAKSEIAGAIYLSGPTLLFSANRGGPEE